MDKILRVLSREYSSVNQGALLLGAFALLSQILGLFRDRFIAHFIGPSLELDTYYASFLIPDLIFVSIASLASVTVLIPFLLGKMKDGHVSEESKQLLNNVFSAFLFVIVLFSLVVFLLMPKLAHLVAPGFDEASTEKVIEMSRIMLLSPIFLGLSNIFGSITQLFRKFFIYSLSPIFYNLGIISGVLLLYPILGISGLAIGVVFGSLMHFSIQLFASMKNQFTPKIVYHIDTAQLKQVLFTSFPRTLGLAFNTLALLFIIAFASFLPDGSISVFKFSLNLQTVPLGIIGLSYAVAAFPTLSKFFSQNQIQEFKESLRNVSRQIIFWSLPVAFLFIVLRAQIVRVILGTGSFSWEDTRLVAASLALFSISIMSQSLIALFARAYYAGGNTKKPLYINLISSVLIVFFAFILLQLFEYSLIFRYFIEHILKVTDIPGTEVLMLPLAYSIGTILNSFLLWMYIKRDFMQKEFFVARTFFESLCASFFVGFVAYASLNIFAPIFDLNTFWGIFSQGFFSGILGIISGILILYILKNRELRDLYQVIHSKFWKAKIILPSEESL